MMMEKDMDIMDDQPNCRRGIMFGVEQINHCLAVILEYKWIEAHISIDEHGFPKG